MQTCTEHGKGVLVVYEDRDDKGMEQPCPMCTEIDQLKATIHILNDKIFVLKTTIEETPPPASC